LVLHGGVAFEGVLRRGPERQQGEEWQQGYDGQQQQPGQAG
jgi:hypothetical protein